MESATDRLIRYLQDTHALEMGALQAMDTPVTTTLSDGTLDLVRNYRIQSQLQADAIRDRLTDLGSAPSKIKTVVNGIVGAVSEWINIGHDADDRRVMSAIRYYGIAQTKAACYEALTAYANAADDTATLQLAQGHQASEFAVADRLFELIPKAAVEANPLTPPSQQPLTMAGGDQ